MDTHECQQRISLFLDLYNWWMVFFCVQCKCNNNRGIVNFFIDHQKIALIDRWNREKYFCFVRSTTKTRDSPSLIYFSVRSFTHNFRFVFHQQFSLQFVCFLFGAIFLVGSLEDLLCIPIFASNSIESSRWRRRKRKFWNNFSVSCAHWYTKFSNNIILLCSVHDFWFLCGAAVGSSVLL